MERRMDLRWKTEEMFSRKQEKEGKQKGRRKGGTEHLGLKVKRPTTTLSALDRGVDPRRLRYFKSHTEKVPGIGGGKGSGRVRPDFTSYGLEGPLFFPDPPQTPRPPHKVQRPSEFYFGVHSKLQQIKSGSKDSKIPFIKIVSLRLSTEF